MSALLHIRTSSVVAKARYATVIHTDTQLFTIRYSPAASVRAWHDGQGLFTRAGPGLNVLKATAAEGKARTFAELRVLVHTDQLWFQPKRLFQR